MLIPLLQNVDYGRVATISGGFATGATERDIRENLEGQVRTINLNLTGDTFVPDPTDVSEITDADWTAVLAGITTTTNYAKGWVASGLSDSSTYPPPTIFSGDRNPWVSLNGAADQLRLTIRVAEKYNIPADEELCITIPGQVLTSGLDLEVTGKLTISAIQAAGGRVRRGRRKRYVIEVDGQIFEVASPQEAQRVLLQLRELAKESAERDVQTPVVPKPPRVSIRTISGKRTRSQQLENAVRQTQRAVTRAYVARANDIARMLDDKRKAEERDEEEALVALMF